MSEIRAATGSGRPVRALRDLAGLRGRRAPLILRLGSRALLVDGGAALAVRPVDLTGLDVRRSDNGGRHRRQSFPIEAAPPALEAEMAAYRARPIDPPSTRVAIIRDAIVEAGVARMRDGAAIAESLVNSEKADPSYPFQWDGDGRLRRQAKAIALCRRHTGPPHVLVKQYRDANYGYFLMEGLPRIAAVEDHFDLRGLKFLVSAHHGRMRAVYRDGLALFGVRPDQIVELGLRPELVDTLIYPTPMTRHPWDYAPRCISVLEDLATRVRDTPLKADRIYISRNRAAKRRLLNEAAIIEIVERRGFVVVDPDLMTLYQQIGLFKKARFVVGNNGAGLANVAFSPRDVTLFALTSPDMQDDFCATMMSLKEARYLSLHGTSADRRLGKDADFSIDPRRFATLLDQMLA